MNKQVKINYEEKEYILEYTRDTVRQMEREGFKASEMTETPMLMLPMAFAGAFKKNHRFIKKEIVDDIFDAIKNKTGLVEVIGEMIGECYNSLMGNTEDESESQEGNATWEILGESPAKKK
jgi:hypothetical protein